MAVKCQLKRRKAPKIKLDFYSLPRGGKLKFAWMFDKRKHRKTVSEIKNDFQTDKRKKKLKRN